MGTKTSPLTAAVIALIAAVALGAAPPTALAAKHRIPPSQVIIVGESDFGATIKARVGQQIEIILQDPWQDPYGWDSLQVRGSAVEYLGPGPAPTGSGADCFRLRAVKKGHATVSLICEPPPGLMMPMLPIRLFQVTFDVRP